MLKFTVLAAVSMVGFALTTAAFAVDADPNNGPNDACMKSAYDLADEAEKKQLSDTKLEKLDGMFNTMEKHCKALELPQAQSMAAQIKTLIDTAN
jgi:hypothetical protein